jgi:anti-sigma B factor antagonist
MAQVSATAVELDDVVVLALHGDLTGAAALRAQSYLAPLLRRARPILVVDLSGLRTCDATGALVLDVAAGVAADCGGEVRLAAPSAAVSRALRQAGTGRVARAFGSVAGAVSNDRRDLLASPGRWTNEKSPVTLPARGLTPGIPVSPANSAP